MPRSPVTAVGAPSMPGVAALQSMQRAQGAMIASSESVEAHLASLRHHPTQVIEQVPEDQRADMEAFKAGLRETVGHGNVPPPEPTVPPQEEMLFSDLEGFSTTTTTDAGEVAGPDKKKRRAGRPSKKEAAGAPASVSSGPTGPTGPTERGVLPALQVEFDDDGRRQVVRVHAAELTHDGLGVALLTPLSKTVRYFPRPDSVLTIKTTKLGEQWVWAPSPVFHVDFPQHGLGVSMYTLLEPEQAKDLIRQRKLAEARALLAEENKSST